MIYHFKNVFTKEHWQIPAGNILEADKQFETLTNIKVIKNGIVVSANWQGLCKEKGGLHDDQEKNI